jgi:hypothetical protein
MSQHDATLTAARPTRRTITRTAIWTVPVIAAATTVPAYAASACLPRTGQVLDWDGTNVVFSRTATSAKAVLDPDGAGPVPVITVDVVASYTGGMQAGSENGSTALTMTRQAAVGGLNVSGLGLAQSTTSSSPNNGPKEPVGYGDRGTYTFSFSRPVSNLVFTLTDIDSTSGDFRDALILTGGYTVESTGNGVELFAGGKNDTPNQWFQSNDANTAVDDTNGGAGNLRVRYPATITQFSITYWNRQASYDPALDTDQRVFVSDMKFDYTPC